VKSLAVPLIISVAIISASALVSFRPVYEPDLGWHLAQGRENVAGRLVRTNVFSFTYPDYRQRYTPWLADTSAYLAWRTAGGAGVQALAALAVAAALGLVYAGCRVRSAILPAAAVLVLTFFVLEPRAIPRPHLASFAGVALFAWLIQIAADQRRSRPLWWAIPAAALWANLHIEAIFGVALLGTFACGEIFRPASLTRSDAGRALALTAACAAAFLITPYGWGFYQYVIENASVPQMLSIAELQRPNPFTYRAFFVYLVVAAVLLASLPRQLALWEGLTLLLFAALGLQYLRLTPLVVFATAPMLASRLTTWTMRGVDGRALLATALAASIVISRVPLTTLIGGAARMRTGDIFPNAIFSEGAIDFARSNHVGGPVFNSHNLGGWLAWRLYPDVRVFQDSRLQTYPPDHFRAILEASRSTPAWEALMSTVDWAVVSLPRPNALSGVGRFPHETWATVYSDDAVEILVRRNGRFGALARAER
jgi:hypothetical protein